jgi:hypothetical protein
VVHSDRPKHAYLSPYLNFLTKNLYLPGAAALGEMRLFLNIDMITAQANVIRRLGGLPMLTSEKTAVFWGLSYLRKSPESAIMKELLRTRGLESWVHPSVRGGKGGRRLDNFLDLVSKTAESEGMTEEAVRERLSAVTGPKRDPFLLLQDAKSWGGKGGRRLDNFLTTVNKAAKAEAISEETVRERLWAVTGPNRHPFLLLQDAKSRGGKGGSNRTDFDGKVAALVLEARRRHAPLSAGQIGDPRRQRRLRHCAEPRGSADTCTRIPPLSPQFQPQQHLLPSERNLQTIVDLHYA